MIRFIFGALTLLAGADHTRPAVPVAAAADAPAVAPTPAGPPWISIEYPVNPYDQTTRGAFLLVHAFHHGTAVDFPVIGTAEGLVSGQRRSVSLEFERTSRPGVYALRKQWPNDGVWTLVVTVKQGPEDGVSAVVELNTAGQVANVQVPTRTERGYTIPAKVAMSDVEARLRSRSRGS
jgi:hypothetical protein